MKKKKRIIHLAIYFDLLAHLPLLYLKEITVNKTKQPLHII